MTNTATQKQAPQHENTPQALQIAQADCCRLIAACFYPPDEKMFLEERIPEKLESVLKITCSGATHLVPSIQQPTDDDSNMALAVAYTRLFLGPPEILAPPYASFYLDKTGGIMGPSTVKITKLYHSAGVGMDRDFDEMPDHIAVMLEFLYYLIFQASLAECKNNHEEKTTLEQTKALFMSHYMCTWIPEFCSKIYDADVHPFYTGLAKCLDVFIRHAFTNHRDNSL